VQHLRHQSQPFDKALFTPKDSRGRLECLEWVGHGAMIRCAQFRKNKGHACYKAVGAWLSNFCHGFSNILASVQKWSIYESGKKFWETG